MARYQGDDHEAEQEDSDRMDTAHGVVMLNLKLGSAAHVSIA